MAPRMGERRPVPILDMERERQAAAPGPVITYKLPPEEIERIFARGKPAQKPSMPGYTRSAAEAKRNAKALKKRKEDDEPMNMTRSEYLAERLAGKTRMQIARERAKNAPAFYKQLEKWGLKDRAAEEAALAELRAKQKPQDVPKAAEPKKTIAEAAMETMEAFAETITATTVPAIDWFTLDKTVSVEGPSVTVTLKGFSLDPAAAKLCDIKPGDRLAVGFSGDRLYFRKDERGVRMRRNGRNGVRVQSESLSKWQAWQRIEKRRYLVALQDDMIVAEVGER